MPQKRRTGGVEIVGTGLTKFERATLSSDSTPEEIAAFEEFEERRNSSLTFWSLYDEIQYYVDQYKDEFTKRRIPWPFGKSSLKESEGRWTYSHLDQGIELPVEKGFSAKQFIEDEFGIDSIEWYKSEIMIFFEIAKRCVDLQIKIEAFMKSALLYERAMWKFNHEKDALQGMAVQETAEAGRAAASEAKKRTTKLRRQIIGRLCEEIWRNEPEIRFNKSATARRIAERDNIELRSKKDAPMTPDAIRRYIG